MLLALPLAGCAGGSDSASTAAWVITTPPDEVREVADAWLPLFVKGDPEMCHYLAPEFAGTCSRYTEEAGNPSARSFEDATIRAVDANQHRGRVLFDDGSTVRFRKVDGEWRVASIGS